jgi:hypothetical protein
MLWRTSHANMYHYALRVFAPSDSTRSAAPPILTPTPSMATRVGREHMAYRVHSEIYDDFF